VVHVTFETETRLLVHGGKEWEYAASLSATREKKQEGNRLQTSGDWEVPPNGTANSIHSLLFTVVGTKGRPALFPLLDKKRVPYPRMEDPLKKMRVLRADPIIFSIIAEG